MLHAAAIARRASAGMRSVGDVTDIRQISDGFEARSMAELEREGPEVTQAGETNATNILVTGGNHTGNALHHRYQQKTE